MEKDVTGFKVYKGLQRPLVFKSLKGKFIYWGASVVCTSFLLCVVVGSIFGMAYGLVVLLVSSLGGLYLVIQQQSRGLHSKSPKAGIYVIHKVFRGFIE